MDSELRIQLQNALEAYDKRRVDRQLPADGLTRVPYGTAGFRGEASKIEHIFYNVGLISALKCFKSNANTGIMITASHNPIQDNGIKLIEYNGEMLEQEWEPQVEMFCNIHDHEKILTQLDELILDHEIDSSKKCNGQVFIGMDSRPSSEALAALVKQGLDSWAPLISYIDYGLITTPALHYLVGESNRLQIKELPVKTYYEQLISGLVQIFSTPPESSENYKANQLVLDCANGVGYETMEYLCKNADFFRHLPITLINAGDGILNLLCGADHVKSTKMPPSGALDTSMRYAALDGDADRVVYFYLDNEGDSELRLNLLDGDKIMALYALYLKEALKKANLDDKLSMGIVQTAYANGASTDFMHRELGLKVDCVDTGVKNLHRQALNYDIGIYFEANGHGTIWVSPEARSMIEAGSAAGDTAATDLRKLLIILNNYTGDAISDILIVETILRHYDWDVKRWFRLYSDRPNSLIKISVADRDLIETTNAGRTCLKPEGLQANIDSLVETFGTGARCFIRPSGTENVARIYAESNDQESAERLANLAGVGLMKVLQHV